MQGEVQAGRPVAVMFTSQVPSAATVAVMHAPNKLVTHAHFRQEVHKLAGTTPARSNAEVNSASARVPVSQ